MSRQAGSCSSDRLNVANRFAANIGPETTENWEKTSDWGDFGRVEKSKRNWACRAGSMCHFGIGWRDYLARRTLHLEKMPSVWNFDNLNLLQLSSSSQSAHKHQQWYAIICFAIIIIFTILIKINFMYIKIWEEYLFYHFIIPINITSVPVFQCRQFFIRHFQFHRELEVYMEKNTIKCKARHPFGASFLGMDFWLRRTSVF